MADWARPTIGYSSNAILAKAVSNARIEASLGIYTKVCHCIVMKVPVKCRKCRAQLFTYPEVLLQDSHGMRFLENLQTSTDDSTPRKYCCSDVIYIPEDTKPSWLDEILQKQGWEKGKINCPKCDARIGSYNFVSGMKCQCEENYVVPAIHLVKRSLDLITPSHSATLQLLVSRQE